MSEVKEDAKTLTDLDVDESADPVEEAEEVQEEKVEAEPVETPTVEAERTYKYRGHEYTLAEMEKQGLLEDVLTTAEQFPHLQKKYTERLEADREAAPVQPTAPQPQQLRQAVNSQIQNALPVVLEHVVKDKLYGEQFADFAETWPEPVALVLSELNGLAQRLGKIEATQGSAEEKVVVENLNQAAKVFESTLDELGKDELTSALADAKVRGEFTKTFEQSFGNLNISQMTPDFIQRQALAFLAPAIKEKLASGANKPVKRRTVSGEGSGSRPARAVDGDINKALKALDDI